MPRQQIPSLEVELAAYFAGLFDGEGYITVDVRKHKNSAVLYAGIGSTDFSVLELLRRTFGGCLTAVRISSNVSKKLSREWKITNDGVADFLRVVYPYLRIKKHQAALAFKCRKIMDQTFRSKDAHRRELLVQLATDIRLLNRGTLPAVETVKGTPESPELSQSKLPF